ncbi:Superfamily II DNA/RNA helicases, SNF2 family [uncultured Gammaproteobacteria bacterium]|nr:Superfamily II DNA/RNA helicases, SNF2 family [uncultured Gammaproteobacteria bacterium]CAC9516828.1 Superfamily II DNA/RNA helicases, SNF2 family [uncultured Gammaproteobacteria bacterium]CAC9978059.1 Superfamily II DNA/RNA helicases, SNF2 family [uncultured Gammaproteobacteria bacterium]
MVYTTYTGKRDTASRLKRLFENENLKTAILRSTVGTDKREDWIIATIFFVLAKTGLFFVKYLRFFWR